MDDNTTEVAAAAVIVPEPFLAATGLGDDLEAYGVSESTIRLSLTLHPDDGDERGRLVTVAATTHADAPVVASGRLTDVFPLTGLLGEVLQSLVAELPQRKLLAIERYKLSAAKAALDAEAKAKAQAAASAPRTKTKSAAAPATKKSAAAAAAPDSGTQAPQATITRPAETSMSLFPEDDPNG
ncbi:MAG: hypothetical protein IT175_07170 [Acidobacteria bacterium]|nr:hypothetical protein [Acidobacteriota bacterium]